MTPTARTLKRLRDQGYMAEVVEKYNQFSRTRKDLFGYIDVVAIDPACTLGVQSTSRGNISSRKKKILTECRDAAQAWLAGPARRIEIWGWGKNKKGRWECRVVEITQADLQETND